MRRQPRRFRLGNAIIASLTIAVALITIFGLLDEGDTPVSDIASLLLQMAAITIALAVIIGIVNLWIVHLRRLFGRQGGALYSLITLLSAIFVTVVYILDEAEMWQGDLEGEQLSPVLFDALQISIESALAGLIAFFLVYAAYRMMDKRFNWIGAIFLTAVVIVLLGWLPFKDVSVFSDAREWVMQYPVLAGSRGLLIGIGLGTVIVAVRTLTGYDRAYREP